MKLFKSSQNSSLFSYFIFVSLLGSLFLCLPFSYKDGNCVNYVDALFTSVSAVCVTGLSTLQMEIYSRAGLIVILLLIEFGGLGILTFIALSLALPFKKISMVNRNLIKDFFIDDVEYKPRKILYKIILITLGTQLLGWLLLMPALYFSNTPDFVFNALFLSISAFCNAGFSPFSTSLATFSNNYYLLSVIMFLIIAGGLGFVVIIDLSARIKSFFKHTNHYLSLHSKLVLLFTFILIVGGALVTFVLCSNKGLQKYSLNHKIFLSFFESVTLRTAGFEINPQSDFSPATSLFHIFVMFTGGSPGSIAGGVKTTTIFLALLYAFNGDENNNNIVLFKKTIPASSINKAITIISRSFVFLAISIFLLTMTEATQIIEGKTSLLDIIYECTSAFATVGLSRGLTSQLTIAGKIVIIITMFIGRTGIFAMALKLGNPRVNTQIVKYPSENVMIG